MHSKTHLAGVLFLTVLFPAAAGSQPLGRSHSSFSQPSLPPGVDYVVPSEEEIKSTLDHIRDYFTRSTPYRIVDTRTGEPLAALTRPTRYAGIDLREGQFNDWDYPMGVVLSAMIRTAEVTGDSAYRDYALKNFAFIFDHLDFFKKQAAEFGPQTYGYFRLMRMRELDDCGAIGAALIRAHTLKPDPRYRQAIDRIAEHILHKQMRLPDGTLARPRPRAVSLWADDIYMGVSFLAQMGRLTGDRTYFDDAVRQVVHASERLQDRNTGLYQHAWFKDVRDGAKFFWGRATGWAFLANADLLEALPADHPGRGQLEEIFRRTAQGIASTQSGGGLWHQLLDKPDSYLETSCSAMFACAIARGVNRGWLAPTFGPVAQTAWQALARRVRPDGRIEGICVSTTAAYDSVYYYNRPTQLNAMQGYGPVILAGAELIAMLRNFEAKPEINTFHYQRRTHAASGPGSQ